MGLQKIVCPNTFTEVFLISGKYYLGCFELKSVGKLKIKFVLINKIATFVSPPKQFYKCLFEIIFF